MKIDLAKAERLIRSIRTKEAELNRLYEEWESLSAKPKRAKPVRKADPKSATSRILKAIADGKSGDEYTPASFSHIADEKKVKTILEKQVYIKRIRRIRTGVYGKAVPQLAGVA